MEINFFPVSTRSNEERRTKALDRGSPSDDYKIFGYDYFDNKVSNIGYNGYNYDGRFESICNKIIAHYNLKLNSDILEIGCAKGFLCYEFFLKSMNITGLDISQYAVDNCIPDIKNYISVADISYGLKYKDQTFDFLISKEVLPHLPPDRIPFILQEMRRVSRHAFVEIQCVENHSDKDLFLKWDPTHKSIFTKKEWVTLFEDNFPELDYSFRTLV